MTEPTNQQVRDFIVDLLRVQKKHDLWIDADESSPLFIGNDKMDGDIQVFWEPREDGKPVEHLCAKLEPETVTTKDDQ